MPPPSPEGLSPRHYEIHRRRLAEARVVRPWEVEHRRLQFSSGSNVRAMMMRFRLFDLFDGLLAARSRLLADTVAFEDTFPRPNGAPPAELARYHEHLREVKGNLWGSNTLILEATYQIVDTLEQLVQIDPAASEIQEVRDRWKARLEKVARLRGTQTHNARDVASGGIATTVVIQDGDASYVVRRPNRPDEALESLASWASDLQTFRSELLDAMDPWGK